MTPSRLGGGENDITSLNLQQRVTAKQTPVTSGWTIPVEGVSKINVAGAYSEHGAGIGEMVRNHQGPAEALMAERIEGALNAEHVKCLAFLKAIQFANDYGISYFILEGDAQGIFRGINNQKQDPSMLRNLVSCCKSLLSTFDFVQVKYVNGKHNEPAHLVAHKALSLPGNHIWLVDFPKDIVYAANADLC